jgi:signal transduction histidine kinase
VGSRYRLTIFVTAFGAAALVLVFVVMTMSPVISGELQTRLITITALGVGGAVVGALLVSSMLAAPHEKRVSSMVELARRYAVGDLRRGDPDYGDDELGEIARAMESAIQTLGVRLDELSRDRTRMVAILSSMVEGVLVVDEHGRLQHVNDAARRMLRMDTDAENRTYVEVIRHPGIVAEIKAVLGGQQSQGLEFSLIRDVNRIFVARVAPVISAGRGVVVVLHDITDLRRSDPPRLRRQRLPRAADPVDRNQRLCRSAAGSPRGRRGARAVPRDHPSPYHANGAARLRSVASRADRRRTGDGGARAV